MTLILGSGQNLVSTDNSSTTPLLAGLVFTGAWEDVSAHNSLVVACKTDQDGTLKVEFSPDGVNTDSSLTRYYRTGNIEPPHRFTITRQYARVTFTNTSASDQTAFRLQTLLSGAGDLNAPLDSKLSQDFDSIATRPSDYTNEVALGLRQNQTLWNKFGYNPDIDGAEETVWSQGGSFTRMTSADTLDIVSTDANDTAAGTGVQQVVIYGVDANWDEQIEVVAMNGVTPVTTVGTWLGVNRIAVFLSGSSNVNAGVITAATTTGANIQAHMPAGGSVTQQCIFFVPRNHQFLAKWLYANIVKVSGGGGSPTSQIRMLVYSAVNNTSQEVYRAAIDSAVNGFMDVNQNVPFPIGEKSIIELVADSDTANTQVTGRFSGILVRDIDA